MKTLTEFPGMNLKNAAKIKSDLVTSGKTPEELPQAMSEALKIEGDRLNFLMNALEIIGDKLNDLKRAVIFSFTEGEKPAQGMIQKGENMYLVEYYPSLEKKKPEGKFQGRPGGDKRKGKGKRGKGRGRRGERNAQGNRGGGRGPSGEGGEQNERGERAPRPDRGERRPRPPRRQPPAPPAPGAYKIIPRTQAQATAPDSTGASQPEQAGTPATETPKSE